MLLILVLLINYSYGSRMTCNWTNETELDQCMTEISNLSSSSAIDDVTRYTISANRGVVLDYTT